MGAEDALALRWAFRRSLASHAGVRYGGDEMLGEGLTLLVHANLAYRAHKSIDPGNPVQVDPESVRTEPRCTPSTRSTWYTEILLTFSPQSPTHGPCCQHLQVSH